MNKSLLWWIGLILFVFGAFGAIVPPENYPGWYARAWGITHPYTTDKTGSSAGVNAQIWTGRGEKGVGGNTRLELDQPALRQEAADADARVDGRSQHRTWMLFVAVIGLFLMILDWMRRDRESDDRRLDHLEKNLLGAPVPPDESVAPTASTPTNPFTEQPQSDSHRMDSRAPSEPVNDDPEPDWWTKLWAPFHRKRHQTTVVAAPAEPIKIVITLESNGQGTKPAEGEGGQEWKAEAKHTLTADLPPMTVRSVNAHIKVGGHNTITDAKLDVQ